MAYTFTKNFDNIMLGMSGFYQASTLNDTNYLSDATVVSKKLNAYQASQPYSILAYQNMDGYTTTNTNLFNSSSLILANGTGTVSYYDYEIPNTYQQILNGQVKYYGSYLFNGTSSASGSNKLTMVQNVACAGSYDSGTGKYYITIHFRVQNNTADSHTVSEIAFAPRMRPTISTSSLDDNRYMIFHEILDSAVTIPAGEYWDYEKTFELPNFRPNKPSV